MAHSAHRRLMDAQTASRDDRSGSSPDHGRENSPAAREDPDRVDELLRGHVLEQEPVGLQPQSGRDTLPRLGP